jgi:hypothetical protein
MCLVLVAALMSSCGGSVMSSEATAPMEEAGLPPEASVTLVDSTVAESALSTDVGSTAPLPPDSATMGTGQIRLQISVGNLTVNKVDYTLTGHGVTKTGTFDFSNGAMPATTIDEVPAGDGYMLVLRGAVVDSPLTCSGQATANVAKDATTIVTVLLLCPK